LPRDGIEFAQADRTNPFDAPIFPGLPIISMDAAPRPALAVPPPAPAPQEIRKVNLVKPIPLEPGGEMAVPVIMPPAARSTPAPLPMAAPTPLSPRGMPAPPQEARPVPVAAVPPPIARPAPPLPVAAAPNGSAGRMVQIGAFRDRAVAEKALAEWRRQVPAAFGPGLEPSIQFADLGSRGTFYRIRVGGLPDSRAAGDFCNAFKGAGRDCYLVP
jgi:hypothetical protein